MEAVGMIASTIQLVEFSYKVFRKARRIYGAAGGAPEEHEALRHGADGLLSCVGYLKAQRQLQGDHGDDAVDAICLRATTLVGEISAILDRLRITGEPSKWDCLKTTLKIVGMEKKFAILDQRIVALRRDLDMERQKLENRLICERLDLQNHAVEEVRSGINDLKLIHRKTLELVSLNARKPRDYGYPWEASESITVDDGIGPLYEFPIDLCSNIEDFIAVLRIKFKSRQLPGLHQVEMGHVSLSDASSEMALTKTNWKACVKTGGMIRASFVMSRWHGLNYQKCARCRKPYNKATNISRFRTCTSCKLSLCLVEPDKIPFEPIDMIIGRDRDVYRDYRLHGRKAISQASDNLVDCDHTPSDQDIRPDEAAGETPVDMVCRYLVVKWEPIFNVVHRYLCCRCVIRLSTPSRSRFDEEMNMLVPAICPRHTNDGLERRDYGDLVSNSEDPYFDQYGGYDVFRAILSLGRSCSDIGNLYSSEDEKDISLKALAGMNRALLLGICEKLDFERFSCLRDYGAVLPQHIAALVQKRQDLEAAESSSFDLSNIFGRGEILEEIPAIREVKEILAGKWDGIPHWSLDQV